MKEQSRVRLSKQEQQELRRLLQSGLQPVRTVLRALALRQRAEGQTVRQVAKNVALTPKTVWLISQRFRQGGLERALYERPRPGKAALLDAQHRQRIVALVCGPPPEGRARWTVRLLTEEVVQRKLVPRVGRETIRVLLESHDLKPWRKKNVVRGRTGPGLHRSEQDLETKLHLPAGGDGLAQRQPERGTCDIGGRISPVQPVGQIISR